MKRALTLGLLASTALATPALAQTPPQAASQPPAPAANPAVDQTEIIITATKREESLQNVPISVQAIGTRRLDQLNISNFEDYTKQLPSVSFQTAQPGLTTVYERGIASGGDGNHSGSLPSVGVYLDEQPVTTIGGTLDIHIYDIARIESLAGPQGTLYGASSEAGTIRIITNKPELGVFTGRVDAEGNLVAHGGAGGKLEGMINFPIGDKIAFRGVAFWQHDAGYIDNILRSRSYYIYDPNVPDVTVSNAALVKNNFNDQDVYGGRAALKIDLADNWTAEPTFFYQKMKANGGFFYDPQLGDLKIDRYRKDVRKDRFWQAALTVQGKIANFDVTYAGAYMDRPTYTLTDYADYADQYDLLYANYNPSYRGLAYFYYMDSAGNFINPQQFIEGTDHFRKMSQEFRIASPADKPFRVIAGAFYQRQSNFIHQDYKIDNLDPLLSVNGHPGTLWLTQQKRVDKDWALFGEASYDVTPKFTLTAGGRLFKYDNSLIGFFGFGRNPSIDPTDGRPYTLHPFNGAGSSRTGVAGCFLTSGLTLRQAFLDPSSPPTSPFAPSSVNVPGAPCYDLGDFVNGKVVPKHAKDHGFIHRLNAQYKPRENMMFYATWSRGFRPGGINRRLDIGPYASDFLSNYELGWKTTLGPLRWNGAIYHQLWKKFQFSFLGANSFTEIHNGKDARVNGIETDINYVHGGLSVTAAAAYTDAKTKGNICNEFADTSPDCSGTGTDFITAPSGTRLPVTPKFKGSTTVRYTWPAWADVKAHVQGVASWQSSAPSSLRTRTALAAIGTDCTQIGFPVCDPNLWQGKIRSAFLFDAFAGLDFHNYNVELFAINVLDKRNDLSRGTACGSCTKVLIVPGRPRTIGLRAGWKF